MALPSSRLRISHLLLLAGICGLAMVPFLFYGNASGHDFEFHMFSWMDVLTQWKHGILYPRWAWLAHWGYGEARFLFYPPASWTLGAALGSVLPWKMVPGIFCWIVLTTTGLAMYGLARQWLPPSDALFAAAFYALNPYHILIVYWRSAYAELLASALLPIALLCVSRLREPGWRSTFWLSLVLAGAWLTNDPAAVMIHYSVGILVLMIAVQERSARPLVRTAFAVILGAGLASFYLIPAIYEQRWVNISEVLAPGVRPQDNFLFTMTADPDHNRFNLLVSLVAMAEIVALALALAFSRRSGLDPRRWKLVSLWGVMTAFVMLSASALLWRFLPEFRFVQLPFRWLLCMNAALAILLAAATMRPLLQRSKITQWTARVTIVVLLVGSVVLISRRSQPPWWDSSRDIADMNSAIAAGTGYEGIDEYVPAGTDPYDVTKCLPRVSADDGSAVEAQILQWAPEERLFTIHTRMVQNIQMRLFNYPAWQVEVNGRRTATTTSDGTGLMIIPVPAGDSEIRIHFTRTIDRTLGACVSLLSLLAFCVLWKQTQRTQGSRSAA